MVISEHVFPHPRVESWPVDDNIIASAWLLRTPVGVVPLALIRPGPVSIRVLEGPDP